MSSASFAWAPHGDAITYLGGCDSGNFSWAGLCETRDDGQHFLGSITLGSVTPLQTRQLAWSATGESIALVTDVAWPQEPGQPGPHLLFVDAASVDVEDLSGGGGVSWDTPSWSPEGESFAVAATYVRTDFPGDDPSYGGSDVWIYLEGELTRSEASRVGSDEHSPAWSPDGRSIAYASDELGDNHLYILPSEGGQPRLVSSEPMTGVQWFRDGERLLVILTAADPPHLAVIDVATGDVVEHYPGVPYGELSPDETRVVTVDPGTDSVHVVSLMDGSVMDMGPGDQPKWRPTY